MSFFCVWISIDIRQETRKCSKTNFFCSYSKKNLILRSILEYFFHFWGLPEFPDFQIPDSRKSGNSLEMAVFHKLQHIRYFSHSVWVPKLGFYLRIFEFSFCWNFQIPENLEMAIFHKLQHISYFFHSVLFTEFDFSFGIFEFSFSVAIVKNSNFQIFWNLEPGNSMKMRIQKFWVKNQTQWT